MNTTQRDPLQIKLTKTSIMLDPATIVAHEASSVVNEAFYQVRKNYSMDYEVMTAFYREMVRKGNVKYLTMNEAVIDIDKKEIVQDKILVEITLIIPFSVSFHQICQLGYTYAGCLI